MPYCPAAEALRATEQKALTAAYKELNASLTNPEAHRNAQAQIQEIQGVLDALQTSQLTPDEIAQELAQENDRQSAGYATL